MVDAAIFLSMLVCLGLFWRGRRLAAKFAFFIALIGVILLFKHHATDALNISL
ncbi:MAG: DUF5993 family protein [Planctomycetota bacterium]|nr:DUF5993 family protein [Planctomycetota bacterium]